MRAHYANELSALRSEFLAKEQELNKAKRSEQIESPQEKPQLKTAALRSPPRDSLQEELNNVKAERDLYYSKLISVREKLQITNQNRNLNMLNFHTGQTLSSLCRNE